MAVLTSQGDLDSDSTGHSMRLATDLPTPGLEWAHPLVREWFVNKFGTPTEPQEQGWPHILAGKTTLICAPTGSGKTFAAFLACIDRLVRKALSGQLEDRTEVLYVSPLKALGNDIHKNLEEPLGEILQLAHQKGFLMPEIRSGVRTGDTLMHQRRAMQKRPPHILVTTPESFYILITAAKSREMLRTVETVIVDEIHAMADDKRGAHLALSLERLEALTGKPPLRIGLSATQKPIELVADFLTGNDRPAPVIVEIAQRKRFDLAVEVPSSELGPVASNEMWEEIYKRIADLVQQHRSTLVFVNTRRLAERVAHHLVSLLGEDAVASHHGSLSRQRRLLVETKLKSGELRALVATASLELGIDIGSVDLVCQIGSPRSIAVALQRVGRAGHWRGAIPKGRIFATTRDELIECAALVRSIRTGDLDRILIPEAPLDILAQQIVAACSADDWGVHDLFQMVRRAYPYRDLPRATFDEIIEMLSNGISARRGRYGAYLHYDQVNGRLHGRRGSRLAAITSGGAIPDNSLYTVVAEPEGITVGTVDEDFAVESLRGDIILLGNTSWRIRRIGSGYVSVEDAKGAPPNVPFWRGEAPSRTNELSQQVAEIREQIDAMTEGVLPDALRGMVRAKPAASAEQQHEIGALPMSGAQLAAPDEAEASVSQSSAAQASSAEINAAVAWLKDECGLDTAGAEQAIEYIVSGRAVLRAIPTQQTVVAERFFDEAGGMQLVIHAPFGGRINKAWGLALRKRFCRSFNFELQAAATDNGLNISLGEQHSFPLADVFHFLTPQTVKPLLEQAVLASPIFGTRWRWAAGRALALLRFSGGKKVAPQIQRMRSDDLLAAVFPEALACQENLPGDIPIPDHPLVRETMKDALTEAMDIDGLQQVLADIAAGRIRCVAVDTPVPSQFSHEILNANPYAYLDDAPLEERRARAVEMRRMLPEAVLSEVGRLDPEAIAEVRREAWPDLRDADELHDALQTFVAFPEPARLAEAGAASPAHPAEEFQAWSESFAAWNDFFTALTDARRASRASAGGRAYWVAAEKAHVFRALFPGATFESALPEIAPPVSGSASAAAPLAELDASRDAAPDAPSRDDALFASIFGWMSHLGPTTASALAGFLGLSASDIDKTFLRLEANGTILRGNFTGAATAAVGADASAAEPDANVEWCDRRLLARIHRMTVGRLRSQIQPVTAAEFMRWLLRWQHVAPGTQLLGEHGTIEVLRQLQGFEAPANAWERQILARRIANYDPKVLDQLCLSGVVGWGRLSPHPATLEAQAAGTNRRVVPTSVAPIAFFIREEADWMIPTHVAASRGTNGQTTHDAVRDNLPRALSANAREALSYLTQHGASFFADLVRGTGKLKSEIENALWELVTAGLITADGFDNIRALIDPKRRSGHGSGHHARPRHSTGRWSLLYGPASPGGNTHEDRAKILEATCWVLLKRYGIVFREVLAREANVPRWRELLITLRRLEDRGEVRGGRFVSGFIGEQFALPIAVDSLRAIRKTQVHSETVTLAAPDPLNLVGIILPGERVPAVSGKHVTLRDGVPAADDHEDFASSYIGSVAV
jgi:ATP-dependent helicase Lhr and Lhr-like helicase